MKLLTATCVFCLAVLPAMAAEPDGLILPPGFHATVVAERLGKFTRHMASATPAIFMSRPSRRPRTPPIRASWRCISTPSIMRPLAHFSTIHNGTAIAVYKGALYTLVAHHALSLQAEGQGTGALRATRNRDRRHSRPRRAGLRRQGRSLSGDGRQRQYLRAQGHAATMPRPRA